jgi:hypothetical protein
VADRYALCAATALQSRQSSLVFDPHWVAQPLASKNQTLKVGNMANMEKLELDAQRVQLRSDVRNLVEKYRTIFEWNVPDIDQPLSDRLILAAIRQALDELESTLPGPA